MSRVNGFINLKQDYQVIYNQYPIKAIKNSHKIIYQENNIHVTIFLYDNKIDMKRKHLEYTIEMSFEKDKICKGKYFIKELGRMLDLETKTLLLSFDDNKIELEYVLSMDNEMVGHFHFSLELEV